jgi:N6-adenosine-specific RNA methylase IME4
MIYRTLQDLAAATPASGYRAIVADPPWPMRDQGTRLSPAYQGGQRKGGPHYGLMSLEDIMRLPLGNLGAPDSLLFLWRLASMQPEALRTARSWGYNPVAEIVWCKVTSQGRPRIGGGHYVRNAHEVCLIATRGRAAKLIQDHSIPSWFCSPRTEHSRKPVWLLQAVERLTEGPYLECFARRVRSGWYAYGDELMESEPRADS